MHFIADKDLSYYFYWQKSELTLMVRC